MKKKLLTRLLDRLVLSPTRNEIPVLDKVRILIPSGRGKLEVWVHRVGGDPTGATELYLLNFPGTGSRAETATDLLARCWPGMSVEIWAVNPPGYGGSSGRASLLHIPAVASRAHAAIREAAGERRVVVAGNSLGCVSALYLAANEPVQGLFLKNPPALREIIRGQNGWWHPKLVKTILARQVPEVLDSIENAAAAKAPAVFVTARKDEVVPAPIQKLIIDAYGGSKQVLELPAARHATPLTAEELERLRELVQWLYAELGGSPSADG